jgi:hypothetical protein
MVRCFDAVARALRMLRFAAVVCFFVAICPPFSAYQEQVPGAGSAETPVAVCTLPSAGNPICG